MFYQLFLPLLGACMAMGQARFTVVEASIPEMRAALEQHRVTSRELVTQYLTRIALYEDKLHAALTVNPRALAEAEARDQERAQGRVRGPLHGIPIALKDNIHTTDVPTTGGALAFDGFVPPYEATLVKNLREAGAIIIAKTGMTELANWVAGGPTPMPANYNAIGGFGFNPYDPRRDPRDGHGRRTAGAADRRLELRYRHGGQSLGRQRRHGNLGLYPDAIEPEHAGGHQAHCRARQPARRDPHHRRPGYRRPARENGGRRRHPARCS
jgi:amidase